MEELTGRYCLNMTVETRHTHEATRMGLQDWANRYDDKVDGAFTQYLLGNRTFEACAIDAIELLVDGDAGTISTVAREIDEVAQAIISDDGFDREAIASRLDRLYDILADRFNISPPPAVVPPKVVLVPTPLPKAPARTPAKVAPKTPPIPKTPEKAQVEDFDILGLMS